MVIQHNPINLSKQYLGPEALNGTKRYVSRYSKNLGPAYVPAAIFRDSQQKLHQDVETWSVRRPVNKDLWRDIAPDLRNHIDCRIQLFFQQLMLVYRTKLSFAFYNQADFQAGGAGMKGQEGRYVAAHDSTLPTLRIAQKEESNHSVSFGKNSYAYWLWNMTTYLPETANHIDSAIDRSFRPQAWKILNQVAAGEMTPIKGLHQFLTAFINNISALKTREKDPDRLFVLDTYAKAANAYFNFRLAESFCMRKGPVDEYFYMAAQSEMHQEFGAEMLRLQPSPVEIPDFPSDISWMNLTKEIDGIISTGIAHPSITGTTYKNGCLLSVNVRVAALGLLIALHPLSASERQKILKTLLYAPEAACFREVVKEEIEQAFYVSPQGLDAILISILQEVASRLSAGEEDPIAPQIVHIKEEDEEKTNGLTPPPIVFAPNQLKLTIQALAKAYKETKTVKQSLEISSQDQKVRDLAKQYLNHLSTLSEPLQKKELENIQKIKTEKTVNKIGLSKQADAVYRAVREQIISKYPEPRNTIPAVLIHLLNKLL